MANARSGDIQFTSGGDCPIGPNLMSKIGRYDILEDVSLTAHGSVSRARRADGERGIFAIKRLTLPVEDPGEPRWELQTFLDRARVQQHVASSGGSHWAPVHDLGLDGDSAWFVSDYHPLSVQKLLDGHVPFKSRALYELVHGIVAGLSELKEIRGRAHGNLKPGNILIAGRDLSGARVLLADPATNAQAARSGEPGDLFALGEIICLLVDPGALSARAWPIEPSPQWRILGRRAEAWRRLCNELRNPVPGDRPSLAEVARRLRALRPRRKFPVRKVLAATLTPAILVCAYLGVVSFLDHSARARFCQARREWLGRYVQAVSDDSQLRQRWGRDADLRRLLAEAPVGRLRAIDCDSRRWLRYRFDDYLALRAANASVGEIEREMSGRWRVVIRAQELRDKFRERNWSQPDWYLGKLIEATHPAPGADVAGGIDRLLRAAPLIESGLAMADSDWTQFSMRLRQIEAANDPVLSALARALRKSAASDVRLTANGFTGLDALNADIEQADRLAEALRTTWPTNVDREQFDRDVAAAINLKDVKPGDVDKWLALVSANAYRRAEATATAEELRKHLIETTDLVTHAHLASDETSSFESARQEAAFAISSFEQYPFTQRNLNDGVFARKRDEVRNRIDALRRFYHPETPQDWLKTLPPVATGSQRINKFWQAWQKLLADSLPEMSKNPDVFLANQRATEQLRAVLVSLDEGFPPAPGLPTPAFAAAARQRREQMIGKLLPLIEPHAPRLDPDLVKTAQREYGQWTADLIALSRDFPITRELLSLDDHPDAHWKQDKPDFWNDPLIQSLVKDDLARLARLAALKSASRNTLIKDAASDSTEIALAAWRLLDHVNPPWPSQGTELAIELGLREQLARAMKYLKDPRDAEAPAAELAKQAPVRWLRYAKNASSESMLQLAWKLRKAFGMDASAIAALSPSLRFDLYLAELHRAMGAGNDADIRSAVGGLAKAATELRDKPGMQDLSARLARLNAPEPFEAQKPGDSFKLTLPGLREPMEFRRVEKDGVHPFYLCTTEVSFGQFVGVIEGTHSWAQAKLLPWPVAPGQTDARLGPRVWQWSDQPGSIMETPQYWYTPEDENDYPAPFRAGRFNRNVLNDAVGGNPSPDHPMQYISAQAALFYAELCDCRLPTSVEWQTARLAYEKDVPLGKWNLRDQTWDQQRRYVASGRGGTRWPDAGIFPTTGLSASARGSAATARPENDGTLFFRPVATADGKVFAHLVGNVAQFVCETPDVFDAWPDKRTAEGVRRFCERMPHSIFVIGGSALSPPQAPIDKPLPVLRDTDAYADVGMRLAFTAPSRTLAEKLKWLLGNPPYLFAKE